MKPDKHQKPALRTWYKPEQQIPFDEQLNQAFLQIGVEAGELQKLWVKHLYKPEHSIDRDKVLDESSDVWYYLRVICHKYGITIDELTEYSREKLKDFHGWSGSGDKVLSRLEREYGWKPDESKRDVTPLHATVNSSFSGEGMKWGIATVVSGEHRGKSVGILVEFSDGQCICDMGQSGPVDVIHIDDMRTWNSVKSVGHQKKSGITWPRIRDLPEHEREPFKKWLWGQTIPTLEIDGERLPDSEQDGYYQYDYRRWKLGLPVID